MAAIFCAALGKPFEWASQGCSALCRGCGKACGHLCTCCEELCAAMANCCASCCDAMGRCVSGVCGFVSRVFSRPFSGVVLLALLMSLGPLIALAVILGAATGGWGAPGCQERLDIWLVVTLACFGANALFAAYLYRRLSAEEWEDPARNPRFDPQRREEDNQHAHAKHFLMYDPGVCLFIVLGLFEFAWAILGLSWASKSDNCLEGRLRSATMAGGVILIVFLVLFLLGCLCSLYSGHIQVCVADCAWWKTCCCCCYYPFCYSHERAREKHFKNEKQLALRQGAAGQQRQQQQRPGQAGNPYGAGGGNNLAAAAGAADRARAGAAPGQVYSPVHQPAPQVFSNVVPQAQPQQRLGGTVYYNPHAQQPQPVAASPVYAASPVNYAAQPQQQGPANYQQPYHPAQAQQALLSPQYQQQYQQPQSFQPPVQYSPLAPVVAPAPAAASSPVVIHAAPSPHYAELPPEQQYMQQQQQPQVYNHQQEGVPAAPGGAPFHAASASASAAPAQQQQGYVGSGSVVAHPVAQPVAQPVAVARPPSEEKSAAAKAAESARAAAAKLQGLWKGR